MDAREFITKQDAVTGPGTTLAPDTEPQITARLMRLRSCNGSYSLANDNLLKILGRLRGDPPSPGGTDTTRPVRSGLIGNIDDIADEYAEQLERQHALLEELSKII